MHSLISRAPDGADPSLKRVYGLGRIGFSIALFAHLVFFVVFAALGQKEMAAYNLLPIGLYTWAAWTAWTLKDMQLSVLLGLFVEPVVHALLATYYMGPTPFFNAFVIFPTMLAPLIPFYRRGTRLVLSGFFASTFVAIGLWSLFHQPVQPLPPFWNYFFFVFNASPVLLAVGVNVAVFETLTSRAEAKLEAEHARSEALLYNLLPTEIATRLKEAPGKTIADNLDHTAILFADIVGFTPRSAKMSPEELVEFLNRIFSTFDTLAEKHGLEKIKTIGDAYMAAAGMPHPVDRPVHRVAEMAFDMLKAMKVFSEEIEDTVEFRIGLHAGPVVAGVIGHQKLFYDVWGDTVNTASRMESHGEAGRIQVTEAAREALMDDYDFEPRGGVDIKGIGKLETWWLKQLSGGGAGNGSKRT